MGHGQAADLAVDIDMLNIHQAGFDLAVPALKPGFALTNVAAVGETV